MVYAYLIVFAIRVGL